MNKPRWYAKPIYLLVALTLVFSLVLVAASLEGKVQANGGGVTIFSEDFEGSFPPSGWTIIQYSGSGTWEQEAYGIDWYEPPETGVYYAEADSDEHMGYTFDTGLFTPSVDCSACTNVTLVFARNFQDFAGGDYAKVNTYSGGTDPADLEENLWNKTTDDPYDGVNTTLYFDPSGYADPSNVYIEFYYSTGGGTFEWKFSIDNVELIGDAATVPAEFSATPTTGPTPLEVQFTDETPGDFDTWSWDFGDGGTSNEQNPIHVYTNPGPFTVSLTASGAFEYAKATKVDYIHPYAMGVGGEVYPISKTGILLPWAALGLAVIAGSFMALRRRRFQV